MPSDEDLDETGDEEPGFLKELRRKAKERDQFEAELSQTRQENAVLTAGLGELSDRQRKALLATHDGDLTAEGLRESAVELGFVKAPEPDVPDGEREAHQRVQQAAASAEPAGSPNVAAEIAAAKTETELKAILEREGLAVPGVQSPTV
jgi:hypothetical protein